MAANPVMQMLGAAITMPGDYTRGALSGKPGSRVTGRDMLESWNVVGENREGLDSGDVVGFLAEMLLDPLNLAGGAGLLSKARGVKKANQLADILSFAKEAPEIKLANSVAREVPSGFGSIKATQYAGDIASGSPQIGFRAMSGRELGTMLPRELGGSPIRQAGSGLPPAWHSQGRFTMPGERASADAASTMFGIDTDTLSRMHRAADGEYDALVAVDLSGMPYTTMREPIGKAVSPDIGLGLGITGDIPTDRVRGVWNLPTKKSQYAGYEKGSAYPFLEPRSDLVEAMGGFVPTRLSYRKLLPMLSALAAYNSLAMSARYQTLSH